ncbi:glyoxylate/hydroxypyruvate reductase A [Limibacillus sp. MBR-115]|jgi:glyoxylate/hydroxypyruvate reductase A|uniref:2-hydroxyacid dehydrogenase n=1 Tax=Limibacillus sp. MBR-115 TaxID=3156465 RepID=UPI00339AF45C
MALLFKTDIDRGTAWAQAFAKHAPELELRQWPEIGNPDDIEYVLVWAPPEGVLSRLPNLKAIFSVGAGIDHLMAAGELPEGIPIVRMVEPGLTAGMTEFVVMASLMLHRFMLEYRSQQTAHHWEEINQIPTGQRRVGILGLGTLGQESARVLSTFGFPVAGWSRTRKEIPGVDSFAGETELKAFLSRSDLLVCLLPLTPETESILNRETLAQLPKGALLVSVGRGRQVDEDALLEALDSGQIGGAVLDVFRQEPLPAESPFWDHPKVILTPHVASMTNPETAVLAVLDNIARIKKGDAPSHTVDLKRGY